MAHLLSRLSDICREHLLREKILVVPSLAIGHQIADALAHGGTPWVNLRVETMRTLADGVAGFALASEGVTVLSRAQALAIIERVCDRVLKSTSYFGALSDRPGLHRAIQKSIDDLRHAGVDPARMKPGAFEDPRKATDLALILRAYEEEMQRGRYVDRFGVLARAIAIASEKPRSSDALWLVVDEIELTKSEERLLRLLAGDFEMVNTGEGAGAPLVAEFRRGIGEENELRGAFRSILGQPFDDAEIVYTVREPYLSLAYELAAEYDVPCTFAEGVASHFTRPGQAALAFLRWIGEGWHAVHLQRAAKAGAIASPSLARVLRRAGVGWGRDRYLDRIDGLLNDEDVRERTKEDAQKARLFIEELLRTTEAVAGPMTVADAARAASAFVAKFAHTRNEVDAMAKEGLRRLFSELAEIEAPPGAAALHRAEISARLTEAVRNLYVSASNPRPGFLHVAPMRAGGWSARSRLFIVGLDEAKHPGSGLQDPILLDVEREAIGIPVVGDRPQKTSAQFRHLLARSADRKITFSYSSTTLKDRRESFPSSDFLEAYRASMGKPDATYDETSRQVPGEGFVDAQSLSGAEWWMARRFLDLDADLAAGIAAAYRNLASGAEAERAREGNEITKWDGRIDARPEDIDPRLNNGLYSASQLETMASCPYRFFLERVLRVRPLDDLEFEPDTWLQANEFGTLLHTVLQRAMNELCAAGQKPSPAFEPRLKEIAREELQLLRGEIPPPSEAAFEKRRDEMLEACDIFLRTEEEACRTVTPRYFEVSFGFEETEGIAMPEPYSLPLGAGKSVRLRGRIDRIDHDETAGEWHVWDYKSGSTYKFDTGGRLRCGTRVQHAVYARAVAAMLARTGEAGSVSRSGYLFPTGKGRGARLPHECTDQELTEALNLLFDVIGSGFFPHAEEDACRFCDFTAVCGSAKSAAERMRRKLFFNAGREEVAAWRRLQEVR